MDLNTQIALMAAALHGGRSVTVTYGTDAAIEEDVVIAKRIWRRVLAKEQE